MLLILIDPMTGEPEATTAFHLQNFLFLVPVIPAQETHHFSLPIPAIEFALIHFLGQYLNQNQEI